jgi:hypothetical protein
MPTSTRRRTILAPLEEVWRVVGDAHQMPRWWPGVQRMEGVDDDRFTQVYFSKRGRAVRMDFRLLESLAPGQQMAGVARRRWEQEVAGTPFERVLAESITEILLHGSGAGSDQRTEVTIAQAQKLRGYSRTGGLLLRRATSGKLDEALEGLAAILEPSPQ